MKSIFTVLAIFVLLVGCNNQKNSDQNEAPTNENEETKADSNEETQSNESDNSEKQDNDITEENNTEETDTTIDKDSQQAAEDETEDENISEESVVSEGNKQKYLDKLTSIEKAATEIRNNNDGTTFGMRKSQEEILEKWDQALNEIYQVLEKQLPADEMEKLRQEQRKWITLRDETAKEDASQFEGGTMEPLEYTASLANTTKERCYELVENYMK
ncbi:lysozyme inhibitor LprI family protein [Bacillus sp. AFS040349]|uniref:lysozyme inhibitor LprI family protein n=1 Tax=Bacillus sp. AFS040349 TaxID=2033502 RepID=UPI000BFD2C20|nr:lysozyme inhibitor LprI family protein [Bacillus sp. AFS040349]PGT81203.1 hypothetical protein COD11_18485 [Bacillus sp. AFS040349]